MTYNMLASYLLLPNDCVPAGAYTVMLLVPPACLHFKVLLTVVQQMYLLIDHAAIWPSLSVDLQQVKGLRAGPSQLDDAAL